MGVGGGVGRRAGGRGQTVVRVCVGHTAIRRWENHKTLDGRPGFKGFIVLPVTALLAASLVKTWGVPGPPQIY